MVSYTRHDDLSLGAALLLSIRERREMHESEDIFLFSFIYSSRRRACFPPFHTHTHTYIHLCIQHCERCGGAVYHLRAAIRWSRDSRRADVHAYPLLLYILYIDAGSCVHTSIYICLYSALLLFYSYLVYYKRHRRPRISYTIYIPREGKSSPTRRERRYRARTAWSANLSRCCCTDL